MENRLKTRTRLVSREPSTPPIKMNPINSVANRPHCFPPCPATECAVSPSPPCRIPGAQNRRPPAKWPKENQGRPTVTQGDAHGGRKPRKQRKQKDGPCSPNLLVPPAHPKKKKKKKEAVRDRKQPKIANIALLPSYMEKRQKAI
jgi:hypothetical protein